MEKEKRASIRKQCEEALLDISQTGIEKRAALAQHVPELLDALEQAYINLFHWYKAFEEMSDGRREMTAERDHWKSRAELMELQAAKTKSQPEILGNSVNTLKLPKRARDCIYSLGIKTIGELIQHSGAELLKGRYFGRKSLNEVKKALAEIGLTLLARWKAGDRQFETCNDLREILKSSVDYLGLSTRCKYCLQRMGIKTIGELAQLSERELLKTKNLGQAAVYEIWEALDGVGIIFGMKYPDV